MIYILLDIDDSEIVAVYEGPDGVSLTAIVESLDAPIKALEKERPPRAPSAFIRWKIEYEKRKKARWSQFGNANTRDQALAHVLVANHGFRKLEFKVI